MSLNITHTLLRTEVQGLYLCTWEVVLILNYLIFMECHYSDRSRKPEVLDDFRQECLLSLVFTLFTNRVLFLSCSPVLRKRTPGSPCDLLGSWDTATCACVSQKLQHSTQPKAVSSETFLYLSNRSIAASFVTLL